MQKTYRILVINPRATSTKIGVFGNENCIFERTIHHSEEALSLYKQLMYQVNFRTQAILEQLDYEGINISKLNAVCGRGGLLKPIEGGTYEVNEEMLTDLRQGYNGDHASNLGGVIAKEIANGLNIRAYIVDPVVVDELDEVARISGIPEIPRKSIFHALNQKAVARRAAKEINKLYENTNLIVTHMGGGVTIGAHQNGKVIDVNNGLHGDGPFSPERAGTVPAGELVSMCFSGRYQQDEIMTKIVGQGGLMAYLHTDNTIEIEDRIKKGDLLAHKTYEAMAYQISKEIGSMGAVLSGKIDGIVLTGRLASSELLVKMISDRINWIADIIIYPGENELQALNGGTLRVLRNEEQTKMYPTYQSYKGADSI